MTIRKQTKVWITKDKRHIRICDMEDNHLINTIKYLERYAEYMKIHSLLTFMRIPEPTAEHACDAWDSEYEWLLHATYEDYLPNIYYNLKKEYERRNL